MSLRDQIDKIQDIKLIPFPIPEWETTVYIKTLTLPERLHLFDLIEKDENKEHLLYVYSILVSVTDEQGNRLWKDSEYDAVAKRDGDIVLRLGRLCAVSNKLVAAALDEKKSN